MITAENFRLGMRRLPAAVTLVTCKHDGNYLGLTATAVTSLSADPPSLLTCVNREASAHRAMLESKAFCINVLPHDRIELARLFASRKPEDRPRRFTSDKWVELTTGAPALSEAIVAFDCTLDQAIVYASHSILIGQVQDIRIGDMHKHLMYLEGEFADLALGTAPPR
ncbi:MAG TPA: flavin reductase family protein [Stellaceae bacterium]